MFVDPICLMEFKGKGISICPKDRVSLRIAYPTVIFCDCHTVINIATVGIYKILSNRGPPGDSDFEQHTPDDHHHITYVRIFPARSEVVFDPKGHSYVRIGGRNYAHGQGIDLIIATQLIEHHLRFILDGEQVDL